MGKIVVGLLFLLFDFNINLSGATFGILPDFVGYFLIAWGLSNLREKSDKCGLAKPWAIGMGIYSVIVYIGTIIGFDNIPKMVLMISNIVITLLTLYVYYLITMGVLEIEKKERREFNGEYLRRSWYYLCFATIISYFGFINSIFQMLMLVATLVCHAYYICCINDVRKLYNDKL